TIKEIIEQVKRHGLTDKELNNSKEQLKGNILLRLESTSSRMTRNGRNELMLGEHKSLDDIIKEINDVDHDMLSDVIKTVFKGEPSTSIVTPNEHKLFLKRIYMTYMNDTS